MKSSARNVLMAERLLIALALAATERHRREIPSEARPTNEISLKNSLGLALSVLHPLLVKRSAHSAGPG